MTRACEWCSAPLNDRQLVACSSSHRLKRWRWVHGIPVSPYGLVERPPDGSVLLEGHPTPGYVSPAVQTADDRSGGTSRVSNGGLQVPVGRMLTVLQGEPFWLTERWSRELVRRALPERQRARFDGRQAA